MGLDWKDFIGAITSREFVSLLVCVWLIVIAVQLGSMGVLSGDQVVMLILIGLAIAGFGRFRSKDFETVLLRALRAGRKVEPIIFRDVQAHKIVVYTKHGAVPRGLKHLVNRLAKLVGFDVEWRSHGGLTLLGSEEGWKLIDQVDEFHGPEYSGKDVTYYAGRGPKYWKVEVWHVKKLAVRMNVILGTTEGGAIWNFDFVLRPGERREFIIPIPAENIYGYEYTVTIHSIAFRDTPAVIGYRIMEKEESTFEGESIAFTNTSEGFKQWPSYPLHIRADVSHRQLELYNVSDFDVDVTVGYIWGPGYRDEKKVLISPRSVTRVEIPALNSAEISVHKSSGYGYLAVKIVEAKEEEEQSRDIGDTVVVKSGDEIKPDDHNWVGSLGYQTWSPRGYLLTNAHVAPYAGEPIYHTKSGAVIGRVVKVAPIKTVGFIDILLNMLFGVKLPQNKVDAAAIEPYPLPYVVYEKFVDYPDRVVVATPGMTVYSRGRTSGERKGIVRDTHVTVSLPWPHDNKMAIFTDCLLIDMPARPGDSGSAIVSAKGIVGLLFAGDASGQITLAIKAVNIYNWLNGGE